MMSKSSRITWLTIVFAALLVLVGLIVGAAAQKKPTEVANPSPSAKQSSLNLEKRIEGDPLAMGRVDAPVVMVEYSDYRCPFCGVFARDSMPVLIKEYVDAGKLRIEWRDMPVLGEQSMRGAMAGRAAAEQNRFWEFNAAVYAAAPARGKPELLEPELVELAKVAGVPDLARFAADLTNPELAALVQADLREGSQLGITGTPAFVINDKAIAGAQPLSAFRAAIDAALAKAK